MGLFDKLRSAGEEIKNKVATFNEAFPDETTQKYYEISYALLSVVGASSYEAIKKYVEHCLGTTCDETILKNALKYMKQDGEHSFVEGTEYYWQSTKKFMPQKIENIKKINQNVLSSKTYIYSKNETLNICYGDIIELLKSKYDSVLKICEEKQEPAFFEDGINKNILKSDEAKKLGIKNTYEVVYKLVKDSFFAGNEIVKKYFLVIVYGMSKELDSNIYYSAAIAIRAAHFAKYGENSNGYNTITEDECREYVLNNATLNQTIEDNPFEKEKYTQLIVQNIINHIILGVRVDRALPGSLLARCEQLLASKNQLALLRGEPTSSEDIASTYFQFINWLPKIKNSVAQPVDEVLSTFSNDDEHCYGDDYYIDAICNFVWGKF